MRHRPEIMHIEIDKRSDVPVHEQIAAQLVFLIGTGGLKPGMPLPSVRALAMRLGIHRNTISRAYHDLTLNLLVEKRTGRRLVVQGPEVDDGQGARNLDELVNLTIAEAQRQGYTLRQIQERLLRRLRMVPPDRLLVVAQDAGMRMLFRHELSARFRCRVDTCVPGELESNPQRSVGAVAVTPPGNVRRLRAVLPNDHPVVPITYATATEPLRAVRELTQPSLIAIVSVSEYFLEMARAILARAMGRGHSIRGYLLRGKRPPSLGAADLVVCDSLAYPVIRSQSRAPAVFVHRMIADSCLDTIPGTIRRAEGRTRKADSSS